jgi:deoxyribonuclease V
VPTAPPLTKACLDVDYRPGGVVAACVVFDHWTDERPLLEKVLRSATPASPYEPGQFWRREMPYLLAVLRTLAAPPAIAIVDGHVWLGEGAPGLGAHVYDALDGQTAVIGVAKTRFHAATGAVPVLRGKSAAPLFVDAVGMPADEALHAVARMAGPFRVPTLLRRVDRLARTAT